MSTITLDGRSLTLQILANDARKAQPFVLAPDARVRLGESARQVASAAQGEAAVYGINTGFGAFANRRIERGAVAQLQVNLVRSHACGVGEPLPDPIVRRMLILKANSLATGYPAFARR